MATSTLHLYKVYVEERSVMC